MKWNDSRHQKGSMAVNESRRWSCRLIPPYFWSSKWKKESIGNTADTSKVASLIASHQDGAVASYTICFFSNSWNTRHRKYSWHQKGGIAVSESKRWGCRLLPTSSETTRSIGNTVDSRKVTSLLMGHQDGDVASWPMGFSWTNEKSKAWEIQLAPERWHSC